MNLLNRRPRGKIIEQKNELVNLCSCVPQIDSNDYPEATYCPDCGRPIGRLVKVDKPLFGISKYYQNDKKSKICGWPVMCGTDASNFYICIFTSGFVGDDKKSDIPTISGGIIAKFIANMKSVGLWDEEQFGLWTVTYCSY